MCFADARTLPATLTRQRKFSAQALHSFTPLLASALTARSPGPRCCRSAGELSGSSGGGSGDASKRRKGPQELCADILLHFAATARAFYQSVAKAIHVPAGRRREELTGTSSAWSQGSLLRQELGFLGPPIYKCRQG